MQHSDDELARRRERGRKTRYELFGEQNVLGARGPSDVLAPDLGELSDESLWGGIWGRPGLDLRTKSLCTVVALLTLERYPYAKIHMGGARHIGVTVEEMTGVVMQLTFYVGLPVVHNGLALVAEVYGIPLGAISPVDSDEDVLS